MPCRSSKSSALPTTTSTDTSHVVQTTRRVRFREPIQDVIPCTLTGLTTTTFRNVKCSNYYDPFDERSIVVDSGAGDNFGDEDTPGTGRTAAPGITMISATKDRRHSFAVDTFDIPLPDAARRFHVFKRGELQRPLLSVGKACDAGLKVLFDRAKCQFFDDHGRVLAVGFRDPTHNTGLYLLPRAKDDHDLLGRPRQAPDKLTRAADDAGISYNFTHQQQTRDCTTPVGLGLPRQPTLAHSAYHERSVPQLIRYLHACAGFPPAATWIKAINNGYYIGWPGLTASRVRKYLRNNEETAIGHLRLVKQGVRRTTPKGVPVGTPHPISKGVKENPTSKTIGRTRHVAVGSMPTSELKGIFGTDQTGRFPHTSIGGHKYVFVLMDMDTDYIHAVPIKSTKSAELIRAYDEAYTVLTSCGFRPVLHRIDNEISKELIASITNKGLNYEVMPPCNHKRNPAERAIQTFKAHFISIISGLDKNYPGEAWHLLIPQVNMTLNMLRECGVNSAHSTYSYIHGTFNFNAHPLAPLGCRAIAHERSITNGGTRTSFGDRGKVGYYIGPAMNSYRVWRFFIPATGGVIETDTAQFMPKHPLPTTTIATEIAASLKAIESALDKPQPPHTEILDGEDINAVTNRLRRMYGKRMRGKASKEPLPVVDPITPPRVDDQHRGINQSRPRKRQKYPMGTRIKVEEKVGNKKETFLGTVTQYDPYEGMYRITFDDGEYDDFDEDEVKTFRYTPSAVANLMSPQDTRQRRYADDTITRAGTPVTYYGLNAGSIWDGETSRWMAYRDLIKHPNPAIRERWIKAGINEFARLTQGYGGVVGMDVVTFIRQSQVPSNKIATYARYVVDYRPEKDEPWRLRITCGGDKLWYDGNTTTHSATLETIKCQLNHIISSPTSKCATGDISNMYLGSDLPEAEYVRFRLALIPEAIIRAYNLRELASADGYVYARVNKAWYGLKQAGKIAHDDLVARLAEDGYQKTLVEGYFKHETRDIDFTLVVDDFLIRYTNDTDLAHLEACINKYYTFKVDREAKQYIGINLAWDYDNRTVTLSMDGYIEQALLEFEHEASRAQHAPSAYIQPKFGAKVQYATVDTTAPLHAKQIQFVQRVIGKLLYYARAVDPTMLHALNDIALTASKGTEATLRATVHLLNYAHTYPDTKIRYRASDMILHVDSDAAYLVAPEARSRAGGYQYLSNKAGTLFNGPVLAVAKVIKNVMASAAEAELMALYMNGQEAVALRNCLETMGYPQPATPMKTDNSCANGIVNNTMKQKRSKAIDMRFHWLRDRTNQGQFHIYWDRGQNNLADFYTKHHPASYHKTMRAIHTFVKGLSPASLQGCIEMMNKGQTKSPLKNNPNLSTVVASTTAYKRMAGRHP